MSRAFRLAGLLRLRESQEAQAAGKLAVANTGLREGTARVNRLRTRAGGTPTDVDSVAALQAVAAVRASTRGMLVELDGLVESLADEAETARDTYRQARRDALMLQKLGERHQTALVADDLAREQAALDEVASRARSGQEGTP
ncbi:flagellar export protein FliJ [Arthrobacter sp. JSM 101049]|uniref:flagellar export protein FliJ n=1 Tax=Arthrobacter sp. JSM 101049 TaxID=929097 RepID=UPI00356AEE0F